MNLLSLVRSLVVASALGAMSVSAANLSFTGTLTGPDDFDLVTFSLTSPATVTIKTLSYAGGTNAAGAVIPSGGFDPIITLYPSGGGAYIATNDDASVGQVPAAPNGLTRDSFIQTPLGVGTYIVAVTQFANFPVVGGTLAQGFTGGGTPNFGGLTNAWALDILNVSPQGGVPDAGATLTMLLLACGGLQLLSRRLGRS